MRTTARACAVLLLLSLGCAHELPTRQPISVSPLAMSPGEWRVADQVIVITDASGTMYMEQTFPEAKALTQSFISAMPDPGARAENPGRYEVGTIGFGGDDRISAPLSDFDRTALSSTADQLTIMGSIDGTGGRTPYHDVLYEAALALEGKRGRAAIVIFSDGVPDDAGRGLTVARELVAAYPDPVCFHAVQTGDDPEGTEFLTELVALTDCGSRTPASQIDNAGAVTTLARTVFTGQAPGVAAGDPCTEGLRLQGTTFAFDRADITPSGERQLGIAAARLKQCPSVRLRIGGHTDAVGSDDYNQSLSERRARAAKDYLAGQGVSAGRIEAVGYGETEPVAPNDTDEGRARNRRVELLPLP